MLGNRQSKIRVSTWSLLFLFVGMLALPSIAFGALKATVTNDSTVQLNWPNTGSSPYVLSRDGVQIYSGSATSYIDSNLGYSAGYKYTLSYQSYEQTGGGYYVSGSEWGIVEDGYYIIESRKVLVEEGYWRETGSYTYWCEATINGTYYSHSPPCEYDTSLVSYPIEEWVPPVYEWVDVVVGYVPPEYGWIPYEYWVSPVYEYITRTTTVTSGPLQGTIPSITILAPTNGQWVTNSLIPRIKVTDHDGEPLTSTYTIDTESIVRDSKQVSNTANGQEVAFNLLSLNGLAEGSHTLKASVTDHHHTAVTASVIFNIDNSSPVMGNAQIVSTDRQITVVGSAIDAKSGLAALPYRYKIGTNQSTWVAGNYTFGSLAPDTAYLLLIEARDKLGNLSTKQQTVYTLAQTPTISIASSTESTIKLQVNDSNPASNFYQIKVGDKYADAAGNLTDNPVSFALTDKQLTLMALQSGTAYNIQAAAVNQAGQLTPWSGAISGVTRAEPPIDFYTARSQTFINLSWPSNSTATRYDIEVDGVLLSNGTATSYKHSGLAADTHHSYRVRVINAGGIGRWSEVQTIATWPNPPEIPNDLTAEFEQTYAALSWNPSQRAQSYEVEADGTIMDAGALTHYTHSGLQPDTPHTYRIRAINIGGKSGWSEPIHIVTWPEPPPTPENVTAELAIHQVSIQWDPAERATGYEIETDRLIVDVGMETNFTHEGLDALTGHTYRVRAVNIGGKSDWSQPLDVTTHPEIPTPPTNLMATSSIKTVSLTWYEVPHTDSYDVEIDGTVQVNLINNQFEAMDLSPDSRHTYRVRAKNISGDSEWSSPITITTLPADESTTLSLTNLAAIVTNRFITLSWDTVAPDVRYDIEVDGVLFDNDNDTVYHHTGLTANEFHTYRIRFKTEDTIGDWIAVLSLSTLADVPDAPGIIEAYPASNSIELHWEPVEGATGYDLEIDGQTIDVGADVSYNHEELTPGTAHSYRVRAKNESGLTAWSPQLVKSTNSPSYLINGIQGEIFTLTLYAYNVQDFSEMKQVVAYNPEEVEVVDLYQYTPDSDQNSGRIPNSVLHVDYLPGEITYTVNRNIVPGTSWSGEITTIVFKSKVTKQLVIDAFVE